MGAFSNATKTNYERRSRSNEYFDNLVIYDHSSDGLFLPAVICGTIGHTKYQVAPASCVFQSDCVYGIDILLEVLKATRVAVTYQDEFQYSLQAVNIVSNMLHHVALEPETEHVGLRFTGIQESSIGRYKKGPAKLVNLNLQGHSSNLINSNAFLVD
ncbi:hypothetical protein McanCB56680_003567 [Microsporum canis]|uniref:Uncharacterized protein n=1 Tax=Arthroderma otae (strain ATCC MYA-4605 / CBS 113480) TaxID=554155 RepID=C5FRP6_ARTOC|nr:uncharacterized protein MCYG_05368 [Microsporum canis CBS 113480]EEQ32549.1 predicted protein [Microsporum canis CBS 113480]